MPRLLVFYPNNPWPPTCGAHRRCLEMLSGFREIGYDVVLAGTSLFDWNTPWDAPVSRAELEQRYVKELRVYQPTLGDRQYHDRLRKWRRWFRFGPPMGSALGFPFGLRRWFHRQCHELKPDAVLICYVGFAGLLPRRVNGTPRFIVDTHDIASINAAMVRKVNSWLQHSVSDRRIATGVSAAGLDENYWLQHTCRCSRRELAVYDRFDTTITISPSETDILRRDTRKTRVEYVPMTAAPASCQNRYSGCAVFLASENVFNVQAYFFLADRVLPLLQTSCPDFSALIVGPLCGRVQPRTGTVFGGYVLSVEPVYEEARFALCPIISGTGQKIKITEAMAHGLAVVAMRQSGVDSPIRHGENGFIADTAAEFAGFCEKLWRDRDLCRTLGMAAREAIATGFSTTYLHQRLREVMNPSPEGSYV